MKVRALYVQSDTFGVPHVVLGINAENSRDSLTEIYPDGMIGITTYDTIKGSRYSVVPPLNNPPGWIPADWELVNVDSPLKLKQTAHAYPLKGARMFKRLRDGAYLLSVIRFRWINFIRTEQINGIHAVRIFWMNDNPDMVELTAKIAAVLGLPLNTRGEIRSAESPHDLYRRLFRTLTGDDPKFDLNMVYDPQVED